MAPRPVGERQMPLEVHLPQQIGSILLETVPRIGRRILARLDPAVPTQDPVHRGRYRHCLAIPLQTMGDLACAPSRMPVAHREYLRLDRRLTALGHRMRAPGAVSQISIAS